MTVELRDNPTRGGHWLEVDLTGSPGNAEAIGATVRARVGDRWIQQWVGQNDDARFSSGHYRLYFGLGEERRVERLVVHWPDGTKLVRERVRGDRLLEIDLRRLTLRRLTRPPPPRRRAARSRWQGSPTGAGATPSP